MNRLPCVCVCVSVWNKTRPAASCVVARRIETSREAAEQASSHECFVRILRPAPVQPGGCRPFHARISPSFSFIRLLLLPTFVHLRQLPPEQSLSGRVGNRRNGFFSGCEARPFAYWTMMHLAEQRNLLASDPIRPWLCVSRYLHLLLGQQQNKSSNRRRRSRGAQ